MKKKRQAPPSRQSIFPFFIFHFSFFICFACTNPIIERAYNLGKETPVPEITPEIPPVTYTVTFMDGDTPLSELTKTVAHGSTVDTPATDPEKAYHTFENWYADSALTTLFGFNTPITEHMFVYAEWIDADFAGKVIANTFNVANADEWAEAVGDIIGNGNDKNYVINVQADFSVTGHTSATFDSVSDVTVSLRGGPDTVRTLTLSGNGNILRTVSTQTIILRDLTLRGHGSNNTSLVYLSGGTISMYGGKISGNTNSAVNGNAGGVYNGGTFTMYGGEISGNTANNYGGGVFANGTFRIVNGTIYGSGEAENVRNTAGSGSALYRLSGTVQYGTFDEEGAWRSNGSITASTNDTIRVVNGVLQPSFISVKNNGFPRLTTTAITLTFSRAIPGLSADDIRLTGVSGITKGTLGSPNGSGPVSYLLPVSGFTEGGNLSVSVSKEGYNVGGPRTAVIHYASSYIFIIDMKSIPAGSFTMGSPETEYGRQSIETQHEVTLSGFQISKYQVTQELYEAVMGTNPSAFNPNGNHNYASRVTGLNTADFPVEQVSWYDAIVFCNRLNMRLGLDPAYSLNGSTNPSDWGPVPTSNDATWNAMQMVEGSNGYRLPTEAQWEYACRAGTETAYNWGTDILDGTLANYDLDRTSEVGSYAPNAWGLYDMHGNVWEWCWDRIGNYESEPQTDPTGSGTSSNRVSRGGTWGNYGEYMRSAQRKYNDPNFLSTGIGFRLVLTN